MTPAPEPAVEDAEGDEDADAALAAALMNGSKKKSKKGKRAAFVMPDEEADMEAEQASASGATDNAPPEAATAKVISAAPFYAVAGEPAAAAEAEQPVDDVPVFGKKKKSKKASDVADVFAALELDADDGENGVAANAPAGELQFALSGFRQRTICISAYRTGKQDEKHVLGRIIVPAHTCRHCCSLLTRPLVWCCAEAPKPKQKGKGKGKAVADADSLWAALDVDGGQPAAADDKKTATESSREPATAPPPSETSTPQPGEHQGLNSAAGLYAASAGAHDGCLTRFVVSMACSHVLITSGIAAVAMRDIKQMLDFSIVVAEPVNSQTAAMPKTADEEEIDALLAQLDAPKAPEKPEKAGKKKKKGKAAARAADDEDLDALLAEIDGPRSQPAAPADGAATADSGAAADGEAAVADVSAATEAPDGKVEALGGKKKKKKGKGATAKAEDEDLNGLLAELDMEPPPTAATSPAEATPPAAQAAAESAVAPEAATVGAASADAAAADGDGADAEAEVSPCLCTSPVIPLCSHVVFSEVSGDVQAWRRPVRCLGLTSPDAPQQPTK